MHSLNVYHALHDTFFTEGESEESFAICALLHDLCKANYYKAGTRNLFYFPSTNQAGSSKNK